jgi:hypothetical protein
MKMLATKMALATSLALATLLTTEAAYAQRYDAAPQYHNYKSDQQTIDEITRNDWNAGR